MSGVDENESAEVAAVGAAGGWRFLGAGGIAARAPIDRRAERRGEGVWARSGPGVGPGFRCNNCCSRGFCVFLDPTSGCRTQQKTATIHIRERSIVPACNDHFTRNVGNRPFAVVYLGSIRPATHLSGVSKARCRSTGQCRRNALCAHRADCRCLDGRNQRRRESKKEAKTKTAFLLQHNGLALAPRLGLTK